MMAVLDSILPVVSRSSALALELYRTAASCENEAAKDFIHAASVTNTFASTLKQIGTIIKEDDRLPSHEAIETLEDIIEQSQSVSTEIESLASVANEEETSVSYGNHTLTQRLSRQGSHSTTRVAYMTAHLDALRATLSVLLQTLNAAQGIIWSKLRPTISPQQTAKVVANERLQLEALITEQQLSILSAASLHESLSSSGSLLLMEADSSQSLVASGRGDGPCPADLHRFQHHDDHFASFDKASATVSDWLKAVKTITFSQSEYLLDRWTSLPQIESQLRDAEREVRMQQRDSQQPMVESDSEDDQDHRRKLAGAGSRLRPSPRSGSVQPLFTEVNARPILQADSKYGPTAPLSPAASPRTTGSTLAAPFPEHDSPTSPRSSIGSLPVEAAAAVEAQEEDEDIDLEIPWQLCTRKHYWKYIDGKIVSRNTDQAPSIAYQERGSWTEIMASWVCKEAIREAGYNFTQVQKDVQDGRRTRLETCFYIGQPLQFEKVKQLVERTVEIYRQRKPPSPAPRVRRSSFNRPPPIDRDRTPVPTKTHPPMGRSTSSMLVPHPPLSRSISTPGPGPLPGFRQTQSNLHIPIPPGPYSTSMPQGPYSPQPQQGPYSPQLYTSPQIMYPPNPTFNNNPHAIPPNLQPYNLSVPQSPLRHSHLHPRGKYDDDFTTSESDSGKDRERRRRRSKSRSRDVKKKSHNKSKAAGVLMGVGGLTALLDGLSAM
ncbi:hypothetical protein FB567DRAFT_221740 [Paraphoma chrysanthemicola]|uniref:Fungal N-terminal domain-containing protein n=1 Tax=Paraphoma chrysanthemicola TaxID=798071 RepID=A0A8K0QUR3_9PLEO|nr:hypothetical protein FB567DRAFT_221740 [Paraphoma chrysanthemicola]